MSAISVTGWYSALVCCLLSCAGCAEILDLPKNPYVAGQFPCLADPQPKPLAKKETAHVEVRACNFIRPNCIEPVLGLTATLCSEFDSVCQRPLRPTSGSEASDLVDQNGKLSFDVDTGGVGGPGFTGYLRVTSGSSACDDEAAFGPGAGGRLCPNVGPLCDPLEPTSPQCQVRKFVPALLRLTPAIGEDKTLKALELLPTGSIEPVVAAAGITGFKLEPNEGIAFVTATDCAGKPAPNVTFTVKESEKPKYLVYQVEGGADFNAEATGPSGVAGFLGMRPGMPEIVASYRDEDGLMQRIGSMRVQIEPGWITYVNIGPAFAQ